MLAARKGPRWHGRGSAFGRVGDRGGGLRLRRHASCGVDGLGHRERRNLIVGGAGGGCRPGTGGAVGEQRLALVDVRRCADEQYVVEADGELAVWRKQEALLGRSTLAMRPLKRETPRGGGAFRKWA